jgi:hypothetical protein
VEIKASVTFNQIRKLDSYCMLSENLKLTIIDTNRFGGAKLLSFMRPKLYFEILYTPTILTSKTSGDVMLMVRFYTLVLKKEYVVAAYEYYVCRSLLCKTKI